ncbi:MAG: homing endonuclease associated repeat-containing protein, partial [bacterium]
MRSLGGEMAELSKFKLERTKGSPVSDGELLADLKLVADRQSKRTIGLKEYRAIGNYDDSTISRRFGTWNMALKKAGLETSNEVSIPEESLFENILNLWTFYGRQPRRSELALPPSIHSQSPYLRAYGSWGKALKHFVECANTTDSGLPKTQIQRSKQGTPRDPNLRLRYKVLCRDRFTCVICGDSPAKNPGKVELHLDHKIPWSQGG